MARRNFVVSPDKAGERLDVFLVEQLEDFSRSWIQKLIKNEKVKVNGRTGPASKKLKAGDKITGTFDLPPEISLEPSSSLDKKIKIVFENKDFIVIDKPSGVVVHPSASTPSGTLVNWLLWKYPNIRGVGEGELRPGIVHRLDKETSGLMVIAKNQTAFDWLKKAFQNRAIKKRYYALVHGALKDSEGTIDYPVGRSRHDPTLQIAYRLKSQTPPTAKPALTHWKVLKQYTDYTLLELTPLTGRMHQLRVHLKAIGHPVVGDEKYASKKLLKPKGLKRMFLHAYNLEFENEKGRKFSFSAPLTNELKDILKKLPSVLI